MHNIFHSEISIILAFNRFCSVWNWNETWQVNKLVIKTTAKWSSRLLGAGDVIIVMCDQYPVLINECLFIKYRCLGRIQTGGQIKVNMIAYILNVWQPRSNKKRKNRKMKAFTVKSKMYVYSLWWSLTCSAVLPNSFFAFTLMLLSRIISVSLKSPFAAAVDNLWASAMIFTRCCASEGAERYI